MPDSTTSGIGEGYWAVIFPVSGSAGPTVPDRTGSCVSVA